MTARYLLRFDDLSPMQTPARWQRYRQLIDLFDLKPLLAIIPCNTDPSLMRNEPDEDFWQGMRNLAVRGATIGLHGYRHSCCQSGRSLLPFHPCSEFSGIARDKQIRWLQTGISTLAARGLNAEVWIAPRHGFDRNTLEALHAVGLSIISDGLTSRPVFRGGHLWIPQQLWKPVQQRQGLWTICIHPEFSSDRDVDQLHEFLCSHRHEITTVPQILEGSSYDSITLAERFLQWRQIRTRRCANYSKVLWRAIRDA